VSLNLGMPKDHILERRKRKIRMKCDIRIYQEYENAKTKPPFSLDFLLINEHDFWICNADDPLEYFSRHLIKGIDEICTGTYIEGSGKAKSLFIRTFRKFLLDYTPAWDTLAFSYRRNLALRFEKLETKTAEFFGQRQMSAVKILVYKLSPNEDVAECIIACL